ncbi:glutamate--tRNA ligase [Helicobacter cappadocius]|uniref:Glutamate--tRNA ligase n=1 Tax=Helicobacter cappadocius TaxID=3063998 RepID=A0AA90PJZ0_9HELI|nr:MULTISPECIES: glutamate--tRNA ligase [unclassified Helicobacter]MDO7252847.1 glutamate--tRNA ligase [Helicobacter sp. faydin-H75]MDP2538890.1 glutamate--tRNA ligase [Helicobacter sp. faydin-H76]
MLRFAPSPTGDMHIGNLRAAVFNYIIAKQKGEKFLVRIEDTDLSRNIEGKDKEILAILNLFGLLWDDLVYQSHNFKHHHSFAQHLIKENKAFYCYCTKEFLEQKKQEAIENKVAFRYDDAWAELEKQSNLKPVVRLKGAKESIEFYDEIKGHLQFAPAEIDSFVILREDGVPTYNFACACDDMIYNIDFIVRGEDHVSNTPKQILIQTSLGYDKKIGYAHLPIILGESGRKMSKRDSASSVSWLLEQGFLPQAIMNYLISMGNKTPTEIFTLSEAIEWFDITNIAKSPVKFDIKRLRYINREHLKRLNEDEFALLLQSKDTTIGAIGKIYLEETSTLNEIREKIEMIFSPKDIKKLYENENFEFECIELFKVLDLLIMQESKILDDYDSFKNEAMKLSNLRGKKFFKPLRILLTGESHGVDLNILYPYIRFYLKDILRIRGENDISQHI